MPQQSQPSRSAPEGPSGNLAAPDPASSRLTARQLLTRHWISLPALLLTMIGSLVGASGRSMWNDEYATAYVAQLDFADFRRLMSHYDVAIAPFYLVIRAWTSVFGYSELSLRFPSALAMAISAALTAEVGRRLVSPSVGLLSGVLFSLIPAVTRYGQEARQYSFAMMFTLLATLLLLRVAQRPGVLRWMAYGTVLACCGWSHIVAMTIAVPHAVYLLLAGRKTPGYRRQLLGFSLAGLMALLAVTPMVIKGMGQADAIEWIKLNRAKLEAFLGSLFGSEPLAWLLPVAALVAVGLLALLGGRRHDALALLVTWVLFPPLFCVATFPLLRLFLYRYLLFTLPAWAILAAAAVGLLCDVLPNSRAGSWSQRAVLLGAALTVAVAGWSGQIDLRHSPVVGEPDFKRAANVVTAGYQANDSIVYGGKFRNSRRAMNYELRSEHQPRDVMITVSAADIGQYFAMECDQPVICLRDSQRIWLITTAVTRDPYGELPSSLSSQFRTNYQVQSTTQLQKVRVVLLKRNATTQGWSTSRR